MTVGLKPKRYSVRRRCFPQSFPLCDQHGRLVLAELLLPRRVQRRIAAEADEGAEIAGSDDREDKQEPTEALLQDIGESPKYRGSVLERRTSRCRRRGRQGGFR